MCVDIPMGVSEFVELGVSRISVSWTEPTCSDISGTAIVTARTQTPGSVFAVGMTGVTYTCTDASGNSEMCVFTVAVIAGVYA